MTAMLILNTIGMILIATAIVSAMTWAIMSSNRLAPRPVWLRRSRTRRALSGSLRHGRQAGLLD